ncbi:hypothetical protein [Salinicoccus carnicancri]|uniref:hypothetical protein n=1 Tax=Salinicoccus carnicancri TaxID=558170 RepID=UPI0003001C2F|nr:hypothetical protein [Salinicoccus carnicancri]
MTTVKEMMQFQEVINTKESLKVKKVITKDDHEFLELKDEHNNKIEMKFYPGFYEEDE